MAKTYENSPYAEANTDGASEPFLGQKGVAWESHDEDVESDLNGRTTDKPGMLHDDELWERRRTALSANAAWLCHAALLSASLLFFALSFCVRPAHISDRDYTEKFSAWSPALDAVKYETVKFDLPPVPEGKYIGNSPEVDAAWSRIVDVGDTMISKAEMEKLGLSTAERLETQDTRTGRRGFRVAVEVFHQLHCLNALRQSIYPAGRHQGHQHHHHSHNPDRAASPSGTGVTNESSSGADGAPSSHDQRNGQAEDEAEDNRRHLEHCVDTLRQFLMCQGDVGVFSFNYPLGGGRSDPWPDYATPRVCRNFEAIRRWGVANTVPRGPGEPPH